jgi:hypothetical protein
MMEKFDVGFEFSISDVLDKYIADNCRIGETIVRRSINSAITMMSKNKRIEKIGVGKYVRVDNEDNK